MKKFIFLAAFCFAVVVFAACGVNNAESDSLENKENTEVSELGHEPEPEENQPAPEILPYTSATPEPPQEEDESHIIFESGILGVKLSIPNLPAWNFQIISHANRDFPLMWHHESYRSDEYNETVMFSVGNFSEHPRNWTWSFFGDEFLSSGHQTWVQPDEPDEVFITDNGLTVVKYSRIAQQWPEYGVDYETVLFIFRQDGRDYREVEGRSTFFAAMLHTPAGALEDFHTNARAVVNGLQFLEGAEIQYEPTEEAKSIGITTTNFPIIDGSTSTMPLFREIIQAMYSPSAENIRDRRSYNPWQASRTIPSYELLINGEVDMILVPDPSEFVLGLAEEAGVELEFTPIASEALVFITSPDNPVSEITSQQVLQIYTDRSITNWAEIGGNDGQIIPLNRNQHSGSQTLMDNIVLNGRAIHHDLSQYALDGMSDMLWEAGSNSWRLESHPHDFALGYTVYFFLREYSGWLKLLSFNGVSPSRETILSGEYPLSTNYFAVIRADIPQDHPSRKIIDWILTPSGQNAVEAAGLGRID